MLKKIILQLVCRKTLFCLDYKGRQTVPLNEGSVREPTGRVYACSAVALLLHLYFTLTAKMEDSIAKLKHFSKLDFQTKHKVINNGRPMP